MKTVDELVDALRVEIGLDPADETQDAWLEARARSALSAMRRYCRRWLWPASQFRDAFMNDLYVCHRCGGSVATLAEIPVQQLLSVVSDGTPQPADEYEVASTGRLFRKYGSSLAPVISFGQLLVDYVGGYVDLPEDLYEVIAGIVKKAWASTEAGQASAGALGSVDKLTVFDVGSVEYADGGGAFYESGKPPSGGWVNPILGPWVGALDSYRDYARGIGLPTERESKYIGPAPAAIAAAAAAAKAPAAPGTGGAA